MQVSIWEKESFYGPKDVIIIGSGFSGLWCAWYLKKMKPQLSVCIVDRGIIPAGASTRNAGFACYGSLTELLHDSQTNGTDKMLSLVEMRYRGCSAFRRHLAKSKSTSTSAADMSYSQKKTRLKRTSLKKKCRN